MAPEVPMLFEVFRIASAIGVAAAVIFAAKLYYETDRRWYWAALLFSALSMALSQWFFIFVPNMREFMILGPLRDVTEILSSVLFAMACYGIYSTMHKIRKKVE